MWGNDMGWSVTVLPAPWSRRKRAQLPTSFLRHLCITRKGAQSSKTRNQKQVVSDYKPPKDGLGEGVSVMVLSLCYCVLIWGLPKRSVPGLLRQQDSPFL